MPKTLVTMLDKKRRSISWMFSSSGSNSGYTEPTSNATPAPGTPEGDVGASLQRGPELAAISDQNEPVVELEPSPPPVERQHLEAKMAATTADVLQAKHSERVLVVGKGVVLTANVTSCDKVVVEGQFQGNIKTGTFVLAEGGQMEGEVRCSDGCIGGEIKATIVASKTLIIGKSAVVTGDVMYDSLQVMDGGRLQGNLTYYSSQGKETSKPVQEAAAY